MRTEMSSFDILFLSNELKNLIGGRIQKIYQEGKTLRIEIFLPEKGTFELYYEPGKMFITEYKRTASEIPESFAMLLRKHLSGKIIKDIYQHNFERIVEMVIDDYILIFELFSKGDVVLCDSTYKIIMPLEVQIWKGRDLLPKKKYLYPPETINPFSLTLEKMKILFKNKKQLVRFLAVDLSFSGTYAEEICARTGIDKFRFCDMLTNEEIENIYKTINNLPHEFSPRIIMDDNKPIDVVPIKMKYYEDKKQQEFKSFTTALDEYFTHKEAVGLELEKKKKAMEEVEKLKRIEEEQKAAIEKLKKREKESKEKGDAIYNNFDVVERIINGLKKAKESGMSWKEIKEKIQTEETPEAKIIKELKEDDGKIILDLGMDVEIDFRKSAQENAQDYFDDSKLAKSKIEGVKKAIKETKNNIKKAEKESEKHKQKKTIKKRTRGKWFESFRWMITTDGFLVVGGKDAEQNDKLFKKHIEPGDIILHADIQGAPLTIVKSQGRPVTSVAIRDAGEFAGAYSSAWKKKIGNVETYFAHYDKVTNSAPSGEFLPKGSFIFKEKNFLKKTPTRISIGIRIMKDEKTGEPVAKIIAGNMQAVSKNAKYFVTLIPGNLPQQEIAKQIKIKILLKAMPEDKPLIEAIDIDDIKKFLPAGESDIIG